MTNLLLLTPQLPYPPHQGTSLRNFHIIRGLAARHTITLLSFLEDNQTVDPEANKPLFDLCAQVGTVPVPARSKWKRLWQMASTRLPDMAHRLYSAEFEAKLRQFLAENRFDVVQVEGIELARYMTTVRALSPQSKLVFDDHNAEAELQRRNMETDAAHPRRWPAAAYSWVQVGRLEKFEAWACGTADWVTAVSAADVVHLQKLLQRKEAKKQRSPISAIPNCIDVTSYQTPPQNSSLRQAQDRLFIPSTSSRQALPPFDKLRTSPSSFILPPSSFSFDLVFSGKMDYRPNVDAVLWFADAVWPLILAERPLTTWAIVGQKAHARLERLRSLPGVTLTGWVESVQPYLAGAGVYVMPFRIGSGTRLKLIEAMASGLAIVSTPIGAEGFPVSNNRELVLAETPQELATAVLYLLDHPDERQKLGQAAVQFARQYDWRQVIPAFEAIYEEMMKDEG
ncbi:MAG: glycosyltransferase [Chloroflexota bacterium]